MGLVHFIGPRERVWFRRCRRAWDLGSPNRQNFEPQDASSTALDLEAAVRKALAVWYFPGMWEWPRAVVLPRALQAFDEVVTRGQLQGEDAERARAMLERYFAWAPTVDAFAPVRVENDFEASIPDVRTPDQALVDGDGRPVRYIDRVPLLIVDAADTYWIMEHRLVDDGWADREELLLAERPVAAAWGWEQFYLGMVIAGTVHNELRLTGVGLPDDTPGQGQAARHPRSRDWARSRAAGRDPATGRPDRGVVGAPGRAGRRGRAGGRRLVPPHVDPPDAGGDRRGRGAPLRRGARHARRRPGALPQPQPGALRPLPVPGPVPGHERGD